MDAAWGDEGTTWRKVAEFPDYEVSSLGVVRGLKRFHRGRTVYVSQGVTPQGVVYVRFSREGHQYTRSLHKVMRQAFGENYKGLELGVDMGNKGQ